jgi:cyclic dehypoxanthinyl futalosine synthase
VHHLSLQEIRSAISELGFVPRQRNVFYELIDEEAEARSLHPHSRHNLHSLTIVK